MEHKRKTNYSILASEGHEDHPRSTSSRSEILKLRAERPNSGITHPSTMHSARCFATFDSVGCLLPVVTGSAANNRTTIPAGTGPGNCEGVRASHPRSYKSQSLLGERAQQPRPDTSLPTSTSLSLISWPSPVQTKSSNRARKSLLESLRSLWTFAKPSVTLSQLLLNSFSP
jgi:hypothetical protein